MSKEHYVAFQLEKRCIELNIIFVEFLRASQEYILPYEQMHIMENNSGLLPIYESSPERLILPTHEFRNCAVSSQLCKIV